MPNRPLKLVVACVLAVLMISELWSDEDRSSNLTAKPDSARFAERDKLWRQARSLATKGQTSEAITAAEQALQQHDSLEAGDDVWVLEALEWLAHRHVVAKQLGAAGNIADRYVREAEKQLAKTHWRAVDAHWCRDYVQRLEKADRDQFERIFQLEAEAKTLARQKEFAKAVAKTREMAEIQRQVLGSEHPYFAFAFLAISQWLSSSGQLEAAKAPAMEALAIRRKSLGARHPKTAVSGTALALLLQDLRDYSNAEPLFRESLEIFLEFYGRENHSTATSYFNLAAIYELMGEPVKAEPLYQEAVELTAKVNGREHRNTANCLNSLANLYNFQGRYANAEPLYRECLEIRRKLLGQEHPEVAIVLSDLGGLHRAAGKYALAEAHFRESLAIYERAYGREHRNTLIVRGNLGSLYRTIGDLSKAESISLECLEAQQKIFGRDHEDTAATFGSLAMIYEALGNYQKAEHFFRESLDVRRKVFGKEHWLTAESASNLGNLYTHAGEYAKAEPLHREAIAITQKIRGRNHPLTATVLDRLATHCQSSGDFVKAEPLFRESLKIREKYLGREHPETATSFNNLANLLVSLGDLKSAEALYRDSLEITRKHFGDEHPETIASLHNLALLLESSRKFSEASTLMRNCVAVKRKTLGNEHPSLADSLSALALIHGSMQERDQAEPLLLESLSIRRKALGREHPNTAGSEWSLGVHYFAKQNLAEAETHLRTNADQIRRSLDRMAGAQSERQQFAAADFHRFRFDGWLGVAADAKIDVIERYARHLDWKGAIYATQQRTELRSMSPDAQFTWSKLQKVRQQLSRLALSLTNSGAPQHEQEHRLEELTDELEQLETNLASQSDEFRQRLLARRMTPQQVQESLPEDCVLVDFVEYQHLLPPSERRADFSWQMRLAAFVVKSRGDIVWLNLGPQRPIFEAISAWREIHAITSEQLSMPFFLRPLVTPKKQQLIEQNLRRLVWEPLLPHLQEAKIVLIAPDGPLHALPFGALPGEKSGTFLLEEVTIGVVPTAQEIGKLSQSQPIDRVERPSLLLVGEIDYDAAPGHAETDANIGATIPRDARGGSKFRPLPGDTKELSAVHKSFRKSFAAGSVQRLGHAEATESAFRTSVPNHQFLHLTTHGFFASPKVRPIHHSVDDGPLRILAANSRQTIRGYHPGVLSGIALTGANTVTGGYDDDGILTALEVSTLSLPQTELVVLSACETGLGAVAGGEGVFGLQRAFQLAGAKTTVTSLWIVNEFTTMLLMQRFYENLWEKKLPKLESLREAQLWLMKGNGLPQADIERAEEFRLPPSLWAAWVLSGDWR